MRVLLDPPRSAGAITLGMPFAEAEQLLLGLEGYRPRLPGERGNSGYFHYESGLTYSVGQNRAGLVDMVEIWRPAKGVTVLYQDIPLFELPADEVAERLAATTRVQILDSGGSAVAPDLLLALWRPGVPDDPEDFEGMFFQSALVAAPGYYDEPADRFCEVRVELPPVEQQIDGQQALF